MRCLFERTALWGSVIATQRAVRSNKQRIQVLDLPLALLHLPLALLYLSLVLSQLCPHRENSFHDAAQGGFFRDWCRWSCWCHILVVVVLFLFLPGVRWMRRSMRAG